MTSYKCSIAQPGFFAWGVLSRFVDCQAKSGQMRPIRLPCTLLSTILRKLSGIDPVSAYNSAHTVDSHYIRDQRYPWTGGVPGPPRRLPLATPCAYRCLSVACVTFNTARIMLIQKSQHFATPGMQRPCWNFTTSNVSEN